MKPGFSGSTRDIPGELPNEINRLRAWGPFCGPSGFQCGFVPDLLKKQAEGAFCRFGWVFKNLPFKSFKGLRCKVLMLLIW